MPRTCTICNHEKRAEIDQALTIFKNNSNTVTESINQKSTELIPDSTGLDHGIISKEMMSELSHLLIELRLITPLDYVISIDGMDIDDPLTHFYQAWNDAVTLIREGKNKGPKEKALLYCKWAGSYRYFGQDTIPWYALDGFIKLWHRVDKELPAPYPGREPIPLKVRKYIKKRDKYTCFYCRQKGDINNGPDGKPWHIDHYYAYSITGDNSPGNMVLACATCNMKKHDQDPAYFIKYLKRSQRSIIEYGGTLFDRVS